MKIGMTADLHIDNTSRTYQIGCVSNRELDMFKQVSFMVKECVKREVKLFVIAGDLFNKTFVNAYYFSQAVDYLKQFTDKGIKILIIPGNHEVSESGLPLTDIFSRLGNDKVLICSEITTLNFNGIDLFLIPHIRRDEFKEYDSFTDFVKEIWKGLLGKPMVIGHFEPKGSIPGSECEMFSGSSRVINTKIFGSAKVFCGHVHSPLMMTDNVCIIGSPVRFSLKECRETKRFIIYDTKKKLTESITLKCQKMRKIHIDFVTKDSVILKKERLVKYKNTMVGILIKTSKANRTKIVSRDIISAFENVGAKVLSYEVKTIKQKLENDKGKKTAMSPIELFKRINKKVVEKRASIICKMGKDILEDLK